MNSYDLIYHLYRQKAFCLETFGPNYKGVLNHVRKEIKEIEAAPDDLEEHIDLILLAFSSALYTGCTPEEIANMLEAKQKKNELRTWPDWKTAKSGEVIEHLKEETSKDLIIYAIKRYRGPLLEPQYLDGPNPDISEMLIRNGGKSKGLTIVKLQINKADEIMFVWNTELTQWIPYINGMMG